MWKILNGEENSYITVKIFTIFILAIYGLKTDDIT